jgi:hypothetical protein
MERVCASETSIHFAETTQRYIPESYLSSSGSLYFVDGYQSFKERASSILPEEGDNILLRKVGNSL